MTPRQIARQLDKLEKKIATAKKRALSTARRNLVSQVKKDIVAAVPKLKKGINKGFNIKIAIQTQGPVTKAVVKILPNQPNAKRFILSSKGSWRRQKPNTGSVPGRIKNTSGSGGLFIKTPQGSSKFLTGAFVRSVKGGKPIVWKLDQNNNKIEAVRGYSSLAFFKANNRTAPGFFEEKWLSQGNTILSVEYTRQLALIDI